MHIELTLAKLSCAHYGNALQVKDWHVTEWEENSMPRFDDINLNFENIQNILQSSTDHVVYISSALK